MKVGDKELKNKKITFPLAFHILRYIYQPRKEWRTLTKEYVPYSEQLLQKEN